MKNLYLTVEDEAYQKLMDFLKTVSGVHISDDSKIEYQLFQNQKNYLENELKKIQNNEIRMIELSELEQRLNKIIQKNEVKTL